MNPIFLAFATGLTTGGISCLAVQGGLLASTISQKQEGESSYKLVGLFLAAKIISYTILGFFLGLLGASISITPQFQGWMQIVAGLYMLTAAANLLNLHPFFRYFVIQPPRFAYRLLKNQTKTSSYFAPAFLGALTVLIPCGITQGMMVLAVASANPLSGAGILFAFTLGTSPVFATIGVASSKLMDKKAFLYLASFVIFFLGILSINTGQVLRGSYHTFQNYSKVIFASSEASGGVLASVNGQGVQEATIDVSTTGYKSSVQKLRAGVPVRLTLKTDKTMGCSRAFTIPEFKISKILPETGSEIIEFTPKKAGRLLFTCSMGMYSGEFRIVAAEDNNG